MLDKSKVVLIFLSFLMLCISCQLNAKKIGEEFKNLPGASVDYSFTHWSEVKFNSKDVPKEIKDLIVDYFKISINLIPKLYISYTILEKNKYMVQVSVFDAKKGSLFLDEKKEKLKISRLACKNLEDTGLSDCNSGDNLLSYRTQLYIDVSSGKVLSLPTSVKPRKVLAPSISWDLLDDLSLAVIDRFDSMRFDFFNGDITHKFFEEVSFSFEDKSQVYSDCFSGSHGFSDVNGDGVSDLLILSGYVADSQFDWQMVNKTIAYARVYLFAIDVSKYKAKYLFDEEIFSYELNYENKPKGTAKGIIRESKFYWGDFDADKKYDLVIRRKEADIDVKFGGKNKKITAFNERAESVFLRSGKSLPATDFDDTSREFTRYTIANTNWSDGFMGAECKPKL